MFLSDFSVKRPTAMVVLIIALMGLGLLALSKLRVNNLPDVEPPVLVVNETYHENMSPAKVDELLQGTINHGTARSKLGDVLEELGEGLLDLHRHGWHLGEARPLVGGGDQRRRRPAANDGAEAGADFDVGGLADGATQAPIVTRLVKGEAVVVPALKEVPIAADQIHQEHDVVVVNRAPMSWGSAKGPSSGIINRCESPYRQPHLPDHAETRADGAGDRADDGADDGANGAHAGRHGGR
jgi:hypothetical protein